MFVEFSGIEITAVYVEEQYPGQKWLPASDQGLRDFLADLPKLGKDARGRTCLLRSSTFRTDPENRVPITQSAALRLGNRIQGRISSRDQVTHSLAMRIIVAIYEDSQNEPLPLRWIADSARRAGIQHNRQLELALAAAAAAGLAKVDTSSVTLTLSGIRAARQLLAKVAKPSMDYSVPPVEQSSANAH